jgi:hypothetical protein
MAWREILINYQDDKKGTLLNLEPSFRLLI